MAARISAEKHEEIMRMLKTGMTGSEIREKLGVSTVTINADRKKLQQQGFDIWHRGSKIAMSIPCANEQEAKMDNSSKPEQNKKRSTIRFERQITRFSGEETKFRYTIGQNDYAVIIQAVNGSSFTFKSEEEFTAFVCELIDLGTEIGKGCK